jgi:hypothetical protein
MRDLSLVRDIETSFESIVRKEPQKIRIDNASKHRISDVFREQILYALGGKRSYSTDVITNPATLDCVWVLLRNTGIFYATDSKEYEEVKGQMMDYYLRNHMERELVYFGAYLLDYDTIARCRENEVLDKDDLVHLLIALYRYPSLINDHEMVEQKLTELAVSYAIELATEMRSDYVYYILMIPHSRLVEEGSTLIATNNLYSGDSWPILKKYLPGDLFRQLIVSSSQKYIVSTSNFLEAASKVVELVSAKDQGLELLTEMLVGHILQKKLYRWEEVAKALRLYGSWSCSEDVDKVYAKMFELL